MAVNMYIKIEGQFLKKIELWYTGSLYTQKLLDMKWLIQSFQSLLEFLSFQPLW